MKFTRNLFTGGGILSALLISHDSYKKGESYLRLQNLIEEQEKASQTIGGKLGINPEVYRIKEEIKKIELNTKEDLWLPENIANPLFNVVNSLWELWEKTGGQAISKMFLSFGINLQGSTKVLVFLGFLLLDFIIIGYLIKKVKREKNIPSNNNIPVIHVHNYLNSPTGINERKQSFSTIILGGLLFLTLRGSYIFYKKDGPYLYERMYNYFYPPAPVPFLDQTFLQMEVKMWHALVALFVSLFVIAYLLDLQEKIKVLSKPKE